MAASKHNLSTITKKILQKTIRDHQLAIIAGDIHLISGLFQLYRENGKDEEAAKLLQETWESAHASMSRNDLQKGLALFHYAYELACALFNHYALNGLPKEDPKFLKLRDNLYRLAEHYQVIAQANSYNPEMAFRFYDYAIELYDRAIKLGSVDAIYRAAQCYEHSPMPQYDTARELYELAASRDHLDALYHLSEIYASTIQLVPTHNRIALANKLYESAQFYQHLPGSENKAHTQRLYEVAAHFGHEQAKTHLVHLKPSLPVAKMKQEKSVNSAESSVAKSQTVHSESIFIDRRAKENCPNHANKVKAIEQWGVFSTPRKPAPMRIISQVKPINSHPGC